MFPPGAGNLFHFKLDQDQYSIKQEDYCKKPLIFDQKDLTTTTYLNEFFYVFDKFSRWQGMRSQSITESHLWKPPTCSRGVIGLRIPHLGMETGALLCRRFHACPR
jgi:hypothetical protein